MGISIAREVEKFCREQGAGNQAEVKVEVKVEVEVEVKVKVKVKVEIFDLEFVCDLMLVIWDFSDRANGRSRRTYPADKYRAKATGKHQKGRK